MTFVKENNIHVIVNCAAYTAVDKAEDDIELCTKLNKNCLLYTSRMMESILFLSSHTSWLSKLVSNIIFICLLRAYKLNCSK